MIGKKIRLLAVGFSGQNHTSVSLNTYDAAKNGELLHLNAKLQDGANYESGMAIEAALNGVFFGEFNKEHTDHEYHCLYNPDLLDEQAVAHLMALYCWYAADMGVIGENEDGTAMFPDKQEAWDDICQSIQRIYEIAEEAEEEEQSPRLH